jgi:hypothetical protein
MTKSNPTKDVELHPDAWQRFERAAEVVAKTPPQHRVKPTAKKDPRPVKKSTNKRAK